MALPASDSFTRTNEATLAGNWSSTGMPGPMQLLSNAVRSAGTGDAAAYWTADSFNANQYSECKIATANDGGPAVRCSSSGCYYLGGNSGSNAIWKFVAPNGWSQVGTAINFSFSGTDVIRLEATGTTTTALRVYKNGTQQGADKTDSSSPLTSGTAGLYSAGATILDDWGGGNVGTNATVTAVVAAAPASALAPAVSVTSNVAVTAVVAAAPAAAIAPAVSATQSTTVTTVMAAAPAAALEPTVATGTSITVTAIVAAAPAAALAPAVSVTSNVTVTAVVAAAPAAALEPSISVGTSITVTAVVADAPAAALEPAVSVTSNITVTAVAAAAPAAAIAPVVTTSTQNHAIDVGNGYTDVTSRQMVRTSANALYVSGWKFDTFPHGGIGGGNYNSQTLRMYKGNAALPTAFTRLDSTHEPAGVVSWAMAIDRDDVIHVVWTTRATWAVDHADSGTDNYLRYAQFDTATDVWGTVENIETSMATHEVGQGDEMVSIAIDHAGIVHLVYLMTDGTRRRVNYRTRSGGSWSSATIVDDQSFSAGQGCWHPGIVFDNSGRIVVTWMRGDDLVTAWTTTTGRYFVRVYSGGSWGTTHDIVGAAVWTGIDNGAPIYVDAAGRYHTCYINTSKDVQYRFSDYQGATWTANSPSSGTYTADDPAPGPGANGKVRIYSHGEASTNIVYWEGDGGSASWGSPVNYITDTGFDCSVNVRWAQYWWWHPSTLDIAYWLSSYPTNELYSGVEIRGTDAIVRAVTAAAAAAAIAPAVSATSDVAVTGVSAAAASAAIAPAVSAIQNATVTAIVAAAPAAAIAPAVSATSDIVVTGVSAAAIGAAIEPVASVTSNVTAIGVVATASAALIEPSVSTGNSVTLSSVVATAAAAGLAPVVSVTSNVTLTGVIAAATASALAPAIGIGVDVPAVIAICGAAAGVPVISLSEDVAVAGISATATGQLFAPVITTTASATINGIPATAIAVMLVPILGTGRGYVTLSEALTSSVTIGETAATARASDSV